MSRIRSRTLHRAVKRYRSWLRYGQKEVTYSNRFFVQLGICAALFLVVCGLRVSPSEPVQAALSGLRDAATTQMDLGRSIGKLEFVGNFMPESVMVFWNAGDAVLSSPLANANLLLEREDGWAVFEGEGPLLAGAAGEVAEVTPVQGGYRLTIACDNGLTVVYEPLTGVRVAAGERVRAGQSVAVPAQVGEVSQLRLRVTDGEAPVAVDAWLR